MTPPRPLRASRVRRLLATTRFSRDLRVLGVVDSTSDLVMAAARAGAADGLVIAADGQRRGRGRAGSRWVSPPRRCLAVSLLLRPPPREAPPTLLSPLLAVATARAVEHLGLTAAIKWPNDVLVAGTKVAGCLVELASVGEGGLVAVCGLGVNANLERTDLVADGPLPAGSLRLLLDRPIDREALLAHLLLEVEGALKEVESGRPEEIRQAFRARDALRGAKVVVRHGDLVVEGVALEADPVNGLVVRPEGGGEVCIRPEHAHLLRVRLPGPGGAPFTA